MGHLSYEYLRSVENPRETAEILSGSQPVGGRELTGLTSAIRIERKSTGEVVFGPELPMHAATRPRNIRTRNGNLSWLRFEFKADRANQDLKKDSFLIVTEHPRSSFWWQHARFRPPSQKSRNERQNDQPEAWELDHRDDILKKLESLAYDPWETNRRYLTAGISQPAPGLLDMRTQERKRGTFQLYGVSVFDPEHLSTELFESPEAQRLLSLTKSRKIKFWPAAAELKLRKLRSETIDDSGSLMLWAIRQALAGPHSNSQNWIEQPVMILAQRIYCTHLYNTNRRHLRRKAAARFDERVHRTRR